MKQRVGALLCMLLGVVLIVGGISTGSDATVGVAPPQCGDVTVGVATAGCPTGTISFAETTTGTSATPPANWIVTITSSCKDPATGAPVSQTVMVPNGGSNASSALYQFADPNGTTACQYSYVEAAAAGFTAQFAPAAPQAIPFAVRGSDVLNVTLTNTAPAATTSAAPSSSSSSAPASISAPATTAAPSASASSSTDPLAATGTHTSLKPTLWIGIAVFLLGLGLLFAGRAPRGARARR